MTQNNFNKAGRVLMIFLALVISLGFIQAANIDTNLQYDSGFSGTITEGKNTQVDFEVLTYDVSEIKEVSLRIDGTPVRTWNSGFEQNSAAGGSLYYQNDVTIGKTTSVGEHTLTLYVELKDGSTSISNELSLTVKGEDNEAPQVTINSPSNGETLDSTDVTVGFDATDNEGIDTCEYVLNGGSRQTISGCNSPFTITTQEGSNSLTVYATDVNGNEGSDSVTFTVNTLPDVDTTAPEITIDSPIDGEEYEVNQINITISTDESAELEYELNGTQRISRRSLTAGFVSSYDDSIVLDKGNYTLTIYATDSNGNENNKSVDFKINPSLSEDDEDDEEESYEHKIYKKQYEPKTTEVDVSEDDRELNWFQRFINWLWELFGAEAPY